MLLPQHLEHPVNYSPSTGIFLLYLLIHLSLNKDAPEGEPFMVLFFSLMYH